MNIVLTGFMGTGKSVVAKKLSRILGWPVIDTDNEIEKKVKKKITTIFAEFGEDYFRRIEEKVIARITRKDKRIISVGGGAVIRAVNRKNLSRNGFIVNLTASPEVILKRLEKDTTRPLLNQPDRKKVIQKLLNQRQKYYRMCDLRINTDKLSPEEVARKIIARIKKYEKNSRQSK